MLAPTEYYEQLKCSICECVLSKFPIYTKKTDNNQLLSICGRCQVPSDDQNYLRNEIYETLARLTLFPCINREYGCMDDLLPDDVAVHELQCPYRLKSCIINQNNDDCKSEVCFINLIDHYQTKHADLILKDNQFKIDTTKIDDIVNILQYRDEMFIFQHNFYPILKHFNCSITPIGFDKINKKYYGQINLKSELCTIDHKLPEIDVIDGENDKQQSNSLYINIENMLNEKNVDIVVTISLTIDNEQLNNDNKITENSTVVKCYKCSCKIDPPIYQCSKNHYVCSLCKSYGCKCGYSPSLSLLNLNFIISQCKYGCGRSFNVVDCSQHENICPYRLSKCLLDGCEWKDCFKDMIQHLLARHEGKIIETNKIISTPMEIDFKKSDSTAKRNYMLVKFSGNLFKLVVQYKNPYLLWRLELIDIVKQQNFSNFSFEITLFDQKKTKRVSFKESCTTLTHNATYEINDMPCIWLQTNQFANLLLNNRLSFKINISK